MAYTPQEARLKRNAKGDNARMTRKRLGVRDYLRHNTVLVWVILTASLFFVLVPPVQSINALTLGAIYALIALGYTMVYGIVELINFAHGEVLMVGALTSWTIIGWIIALIMSLRTQRTVIVA